MDIEYNSAEDYQEEDFEIIDNSNTYINSDVEQSQEQCFFDNVVSVLQ